MVEKTQDGEGGRPQPWSFVARLLFVLAVVVASVVLFKRAIAPERQLQAVLDAETRATGRGDWQAFEALQDPEDTAFRRQQRSEFDSAIAARQRREAGAAVERYVVAVGRDGDNAWVLVMDDPAGDPASGRAEIEFFRRVYGQWLHTGPDPEHWGSPQELQTGRITWRYREADAGRVAQLAALAETFTEQLCDDLDLEVEAGQLVINLCYSLECGTVLYPQGGEMALFTPQLFGYDDESLETLLANQLANHLVNRATGIDAGSPALASRILNGIERWEVTQVVGGAPDGDSLYALRQAVAAGTLLSLDELSQPLGGDNTALIYDQAYTLVEYLVAQYGRQILPVLVQAAGQQAQHAGPIVTETLQEVLGPDLDLPAFEAAWLAFVRERYGQ